MTDIINLYSFHPNQSAVWLFSSFLSIPLMLSVQCDPPVRAAFPSVHAFIMLEGTMNLTGETQPLVEQLMMIKRMQVNCFQIQYSSISRSNQLIIQNRIYNNSYRRQLKQLRMKLYMYISVLFNLFLYISCFSGSRFLTSCVPHRESQLPFLCWRYGRPVSLASSSHQRAQRSSNGPPSHSSRWALTGHVPSLYFRFSLRPEWLSKIWEEKYL